MSLTSQLQFIQALYAQGQIAQVAALEALFVQSHPDAAQAWSDLAWLHMRAGRLAPAREALQRSHAINPQGLAALDGLAELHARCGQWDEARHWGRAALDAKDALTPELRTDEQRYATNSEGLKVVAFSLFGSDAFYGEGAVRNARDVVQHYPGWQCRFYVAPDIGHTLRARLRSHGAVVLEPAPEYAHLPGTVWRFLALEDAQVSTVICRDADSQMGAREAQAVQAWLGSGLAAHLMRDHWHHTELILAGLWGAHSAVLRGVGDALLQYFSTPQHSKYADQHFLRDWVWPRVRGHVLQHDRCQRWRDSLDFPTPLADEAQHCGNAPFEWVEWAAPANQATARYALEKRSTGGQLEVLGHYTAQRDAHTYKTRLPLGYAQALQAGELKISPAPPL